MRRVGTGVASAWMRGNRALPSEPQMNTHTTQQDFHTAMTRAKVKSHTHNCTVHINAIVRVEGANVHEYGTPTIVCFDVSDWYWADRVVRNLEEIFAS